MGCFVSCRISTDKRVARSLCHSRATCDVWDDYEFVILNSASSQRLCKWNRSSCVHCRDVSRQRVLSVRQVWSTTSCSRARCWNPASSSSHSKRTKMTAYWRRACWRAPRASTTRCKRLVMSRWRSMHKVKSSPSTSTATASSENDQPASFISSLTSSYYPLL